MIFRSTNGKGGTDEQLEALADVSFDNLEVYVFNSPLITDRGMEALSRISVLRAVVLRGTSITDHGLEILGAKMRLQHVNVSKCTNVTAQGLLKLVQSQTLTSLTFSCENLTEADVIEILNTARSVNNCSICFPNSHAQTPAIYAAAKRRSIKLIYEGITFWYADSLPYYKGR